MDIVAKLEALHKQATTERSHYYVASCCGEAIAEIKRLREALIEAERIARQWRDVVAENIRKPKAHAAAQRACKHEHGRLFLTEVGMARICDACGFQDFKI